MLFVSLALVAAGIGWAFCFIARRADRSTGTGTAGVVPVPRKQDVAGRTLRHTVVALSKTAALFPIGWIDISGMASFARSVGSDSCSEFLPPGFDERGINAGVDEGVTGARGLGRVMSRCHSGQIQIYLGAVAVGVLALLLFYAWLA